LLAGKKFVVCGYGWCGRGLANRARGMGASVIVTEVDPLRALEAVMEGFRVLPILKAAKEGDIFVTVTGDKSVITTKHMLRMKDGAIIANSGHFNIEVEIEKLEKIAVKKRKVREHVVEYKIPNSKFQIPPGRASGRRPNKYQKTNYKFKTTGMKQQFSNETIEQLNNGYKRIYVLGEGRLINLVAAEGHPAEVMDLSFANQALAAEWFIKNKGKLEAKVYKLPEKLDRMVAKLKLNAMGIRIDKLTGEQRKYLQSWKEGT
jgi:adenosylhomocysteinase